MINTFGTRTNHFETRLSVATMLLACLATLIVPAAANAGSVRIWSAAVVTTDDVRLGDICALTGFEAEQEATLESIVVSTSPAPAGSKFIHLNLIRTILKDHNINLASLNLSGAVQCSVTRPSVAAGPVSQGIGLPSKQRVNKQADSHVGLTLSKAVTDFFRRELRHYDGVVEVTFGRTSQQALNLTEPEFRFVVRKRTGPPLGLISLTVDVIEAEQIVQTIPMAVQVQLRGQMLIARKTVNQGAIIGDGDVELVTTTVTRVDRTLIHDRAAVVGQRAKRYIAIGIPIQQNMIESVPLVKRGQLITLTSADPGVSIVTSAKAAEDGRLGDVIRVTATNDRKLSFYAEVVGVGHVRMGSQVAVSSHAAVAFGGQP